MTYVILLSVILFAIPLLKCLWNIFFLNIFLRFSFIPRLNLFLGKIEYYARAPRKYILGPIYGLWFLQACLSHGDWATPLFFLFLILISTYDSIIIALRASTILAQNPTLHPSSFFDLVFQLHGPFNLALPSTNTLATISPEKVSFKKESRAVQTYAPLLQATYDTTFLAHTCLKAMKYAGLDFVKTVFDPMASMWGKRVLQLFRGSLEVKGGEKISELDGKIILVFNHKSQSDFGLTFFALSHMVRADGRPLKPRFITAKDHFLDNPFIYHVMGIGKLIEAVDMVFIERKKKGAGLENLKQAADFLVRKEIEIAIFPQGTRAEGNSDRSDKRRDAGYYTTLPVKDIDSDLGHLRKGLAHLTIDALTSLKQAGKDEPLHLVFIGLSGTATMMAKQSLKIQTETDIEYQVGEPITLYPSLLDEETDREKLINEIHEQIDKHLVDCIGIHENLKHRFLLDLQGYFRLSADRLKLIEQNLENLSRNSSTLYQILDRIYACPPKEWNPFLSELSQLLLDGSNLARFATLKTQVTVKMLESLKTKSHGKKMQKS